MNPSEKREAYLKRAAAMLEAKKKEEAAKDEAYYKKITSGLPWRIFRFGVIFCLFINVLVTVDYFVDGESHPLPVGSYQFESFTYRKINAVVWVGDEIFTPYYKDFVSVDYDSFILTNSFFFNKAKYISFIGHTLGNPQRFKAYERISIFDWFPYLQIMLLVPLLVFLLKRQHPLFSFMRNLCLLLIFPGSFIVVFFLIF